MTELTIGNRYKHKSSKNICKIIAIKEDIVECVYPPDSYVFKYGREGFIQNFKQVVGIKMTNEILNKVYKIANNAIYFDDNSDYKTALYEICNVIKPNDETIGEVFIE